MQFLYGKPQISIVRKAMKKAQDYRQHASECRALARKARSDEERQQLLTMAATWDILAVERERRLTDGLPDSDSTA